MPSALVPIKSLVGLSSSTLATLATNYAECAAAIATVGQEYEIGGRKFRRPDLPYVASMLAAIDYAQKLQAGTAVTRTLARFGNSPSA